MIQTAESALDEVHDIAQRMCQLSVQAGNDTLSFADRVAIGDELAQLRDEIDGITSRTSFNGKALLDGSLSASLDTGAGSDTDFKTAATTLRDSLDSALADISTQRSELGSVQNRLEHTVKNMAAETVAFRKAQILQQAGTAILARANRAP